MHGRACFSQHVLARNRSGLSHLSRSGNLAKLAAKYRQLTFCYEAGPTGYGLYRLIRKLGHDCIVAAPSLILKKPGDRVKTNRRDAVGLAKLSRAGELTAVWVPDERHEAMRDLSPSITVLSVGAVLVGVM